MQTSPALEAVFRQEWPKLVAGLTRIVRDVGIAEELAQDALVVALEQWPIAGVPTTPGAWLMSVAKNRAINAWRHQRMRERREAALSHELTATVDPTDLDTLDDPIGDDLLRLVFIACHPVLPADARVALTLRLLGGLTTEEIARAFLSTEPTIAQRIVRAKRTLAEAQVAFEVPRGAELGERLATVLGVLYLVFNEGYAATVGDDYVRPQLCADAMRLGRVLVGLMPGEPEAFGLVALMELQASRIRSRTSPNGEPILLLDQDRSTWDHALVRVGLDALERARELLRGSPAGALGPYVLQAEIAACHARAKAADETDWERIAALYGALAIVVPSPVVALNRAVAVSMAEGPAAGLALLDPLLEEPVLQRYHLLPSARADLLGKLGRWREAQGELERAATLTHNTRERDLLLRRAAEAARESGASARPIGDRNTHARTAKQR